MFSLFSQLQCRFLLNIHVLHPPNIKRWNKNDTVKTFKRSVEVTAGFVEEFPDAYRYDRGKWPATSVYN
jgi:hypothetical protein